MNKIKRLFLKLYLKYLKEAEKGIPVTEITYGGSVRKRKGKERVQEEIKKLERKLKELRGKSEGST